MIVSPDISIDLNKQDTIELLRGNQPSMALSEVKSQKMAISKNTFNNL